MVKIIRPLTELMCMTYDFYRNLLGIYKNKNVSALPSWKYYKFITAYLRNLTNEFGESTNAIRQELNRFEDANLLKSENVLNKKVYHANTTHPYFGDLHRLLLKYVGIDQVVDELVNRIGHLEKAFVTNDFAQGKPGNIIDLVLVGSDFDEADLMQKKPRLTSSSRYGT